MQLHLLRPLQGWRAFAGEVGVIVLGVLLALGAQQFVEEMRIRGEVKTFRETIDREIALNLYVYDVRVRQSPCIRNQLGQLDAWLSQARAGQTVALRRTGGPATLSIYRSAWDNRNAAIFAHLPQRTRAKYAEFYDELTNNNRLTTAEGETWMALAPYKEPGPLSLQDRRAIRSALLMARTIDSVYVENIEVTRRIARALGISMVAPEGVFGIDSLIGKCPSITADK